MKFLSVRQARDTLNQLIDQVAAHHYPVVIAGQRNNAVLIAQSDWESIQETLYLSNIPGLVESIQAAAQEPLEDCLNIQNLDW
jgi:antitoxin YefM